MGRRFMSVRMLERLIRAAKKAAIDDGVSFQAFVELAVQERLERRRHAV